MTPLFRTAFHYSIVALAPLFLSQLLAAASASAADLDTAVQSGDFTEFYEQAGALLNRKTPADGGSREVLLKLLEEPAVANVLAQRQLIAKVGVDQFNVFAKADQRNRDFLAWLLPNTAALNLCLEGATPIGLARREANNWSIPVSALEIWKDIYHADADSKQGIYLKLAIATALAPPGTGSPGAGQPRPPVEPLARYQHFKAAHQNKELFPTFDDLTVWEYGKVVQSGASNEDLAWARLMINTWRPDLRINEQVVNSTSQVWRRNSPHPYTDYKSVLSGGGKCGPRSSWSIMVCQAFGVPAIGVGQPGHACVAYKVPDPALEPQPGSYWKVGYGRGWHVSKLEGMSGPEFLEGIAQRSRTTEFSQVERLRWLAAAQSAPETAAAVMATAHAIQRSIVAKETDLTASAKADEAEQELPPEVDSAPKPATQTPGPHAVGRGAVRIEAADFSGISGVLVYDCFTGGKQVNFQFNVDSSWVEYTVDAAEAGDYRLELTVAAPNYDQVFHVTVDGEEAAEIKIPNSAGLWTTTPAVVLPLKKGPQAVRFSAPYQRGVAVRYLTLTSE